MSSYNSLEPSSLIDTFFNHPPQDFSPHHIDICNSSIPCFVTKFDLLTTVEKKIQKMIPYHPKLKTLFIGTTVTEHCTFSKDVILEQCSQALVNEMKKHHASLLVVKDLPCQSPLLNDQDNAFNTRLTNLLLQHGFLIVSGEALAYVPIDFSSIDNFLNRFSKNHRKDLKRKLKNIHEINITQYSTGDSFFTQSNIDILYALYLNVYEQSEIHFDQLDKSFFSDLFSDPHSNGIVITYSSQNQIIGFNLCYIYNHFLVDKYIGLKYPESRNLNLYFVSWFHNLDICLQNHLTHYVAGWTDPKIKKYLGANFTMTKHAVYIKNPFLRGILNRFKKYFESDRIILKKL